MKDNSLHKYNTWTPLFSFVRTYKSTEDKMSTTILYLSVYRFGLVIFYLHTNVYIFSPLIYTGQCFRLIQTSNCISLRLLIQSSVA